MNKPEMKLEGDKLKVSYNLDYKVDSDNDGQAAVEVMSSNQLVLDGSEALKELLKSSSLVEKAKHLLGLA